MKSTIWLILIGILLSVNVLAQNENLPFSQQNQKKKVSDWRSLNLDLTVGYIPKEANRGVKTSAILNNILFHRLGVYTSLEYGLNSNELMNTVGGTITVHKYIYLWGGVDLFTDNGLISKKSLEIRKEIGIGITPYKRWVLQVGGSLGVGLTISAGYRIPL